MHVGGVLRSSDGAESWQPTALDIRTDAHQVMAPPGHDGLVLAAAAVGLAISRDAGETWDIDARGLYVTLASPNGALYRPDDHGETWQHTLDGLPSVRALQA